MGLVFAQPYLRISKIQKGKATVLAKGGGFPCESGQCRGWGTLSVEAMKLQILDQIIFLALANSFQMCNYSTELPVQIKLSHLRTRRSISPSHTYFASLRNQVEKIYPLESGGSHHQLQQEKFISAVSSIHWKPTQSYSLFYKPSRPMRGIRLWALQVFCLLHFGELFTFLKGYFVPWDFQSFPLCMQAEVPHP